MKKLKQAKEKGKEDYVKYLVEKSRKKTLPHKFLVEFPDRASQKLYSGRYSISQLHPFFYSNRQGLKAPVHYQDSSPQDLQGTALPFHFDY